MVRQVRKRATMIHRAASAGGHALSKTAQSDGPTPVHLMTILMGISSIALATASIGPLLVPISRATGDEHLAQLAVVLPFLGLAVSGLGAGWVVGRLGVRNTLLVGAAAFIAAGLIGVSAGTSGTIVLAACLLAGGAAGLMRVGAAVLLGRLYDGQARARVIGYAAAFAGLVATLTVWLAGVITDLVGWRYAFLIFSVSGAAVLVFTLAAASAPGPAQAGGEGARPRLAQITPAVPFFSVVFLVMMLAVSTGTHVPLLMQQQGVRAATTISTVLATQALFGMLGALTFAWLKGRLGRLPVAALGVATATLAGVILAMAQSPVAFGVGCAAMGAGTSLILPYLTEGLYIRTPHVAHGYVLGINGTLANMGAFVNPFVMRPIREAVGLESLYWVLALATAVIATGYLLTAYGQGRRAMAAAPSREPQ
jgi:ACDE family multidrug resistance protein